LNKIQLTPRICNNKLNEKLIVQHLTWIFNININIIGFKRTRTYGKCKIHYNCSFPFYIFQNTFIKLLSKTIQVPNITIIYYLKKYYLINNNDINIMPHLVNFQMSNKLQFEKNIITKEHVWNILENKSIYFPFNINLYTTYKYVRYPSQQKIIQQNLIASCNNSFSNKTLNIFITPHLQNNSFSFGILVNFINIKTLNKFENYTIPHMQEGRKIYQTENDSQPIPLNQEHCLCEHPTTQRIFFPKKDVFSKPLGNYIYKYIESKNSKHIKHNCFQQLKQCKNIFCMNI